MPKNILFGIIGLVIGLVVGFVGANRLNESSIQTNANSPMTAPFGNQQVHSADIKEQMSNNGNKGMIADVQKVIDKAKAEPDNLQAQMEAGDMYAQIGRFPESIGFYEKAQAANPNDFKANVKLGNSYFDARQFEKAAEFYEKALAINPSDVGARTDLGITFVERANPDYDRAIKEFETSLKADPKHEPTLFNLSVANFKKGDQAKAQDYLKQLEQANPTSELIAKLKQAIGNTPTS